MGVGYRFIRLSATGRCNQSLRGGVLISKMSFIFYHEEHEGLEDTAFSI